MRVLSVQSDPDRSLVWPVVLGMMLVMGAAAFFAVLIGVLAVVVADPPASLGVEPLDVVETSADGDNPEAKLVDVLLRVPSDRLDLVDQSQVAVFWGQVKQVDHNGEVRFQNKTEEKHAIRILIGACVEEDAVRAPEQISEGCLRQESIISWGRRPVVDLNGLPTLDELAQRLAEPPASPEPAPTEAP